MENNKISDIKFDSKKSEWIINVNHKEYTIDFNDYNSLNLSIGMHVDESLLKKLDYKNIFNRGKNIALNYLSYRPRAKEEIKQRLKKEKFPPEIIDDIINYLEEYQYLNDIEFARLYIEDKINLSKWSLKKIKYELQKKGLKNSDFESILLEYDDSELSNAKELLEKKLPAWKEKSNTNYELKNRIYRYLSQKGFKYQVINTLIEEIVS